MNIQSSLKSAALLGIVTFVGCTHNAPSYKKAMAGDSLFIVQDVLDNNKERALRLLDSPEGIDLVGYIRRLRLDTNQPVTFGFSEDGGGRVIVRVPTRMTNGTPVLVESQYDYADGSPTGALSGLSFTVQKPK